MQSFLRHCKAHLLYAGIFSLVTNILMLTIPLYMLQVYDRVLTSRSSETLALLTLVALGALVIYSLLDGVRARLLAHAGATLESLATPQVLDRVIDLTARGDGARIDTGVKDVATVRGFLSGNGMTSLFDAPWMPVYLGVIFLFHWKLGATALAGCTVILLLTLFNEICTRRTTRALSQAARVAARYVDDGVRQAEAIRVLGMGGAFLGRWQQLNGRVVEHSESLSRSSAVFSGLTKFMRLFLQVVMLAMGASLVIAHDVTGGAMIAATLVLSRAMSPLEALVGNWRSLTDARDAFRRLNASITAASPRDEAVVVPEHIHGALSVEKLHYILPGTDRSVIKALNFALQPGRSLGVIGASASGKSTLARLLVGSRTPTQGQVRIDGVDLSHWPREQLGALMGYVPQDVQLLDGTVAQNIARFSDGSTEEVMAAARRARAHDMIVRLPQGYETPVGSNGCALSGGQRQLIAIARALFRMPRVLVLDEPNANLDGNTEVQLTQAIGEWRDAGTTVVVISHRPSLLANVDHLLLLREGQVELFGERQQVLAQLQRSQVVSIHSCTPVNTQINTQVTKEAHNQ